VVVSNFLRCIKVGSKVKMLNQSVCGGQHDLLRRKKIFWENSYKKTLLEVRWERRQCFAKRSRGEDMELLESDTFARS
jgi:hypothetical protein